MAIQRNMKRTYEIEVTYEEDESSAEFHCPLCNADWKYPFTARKIYGVPTPPPSQIVVFHLYGCGAQPKPCPGFDFSVPITKDLSATRTTLMLVQKRLRSE